LSGQRVSVTHSVTTRTHNRWMLPLSIVTARSCWRCGSLDRALASARRNRRTSAQITSIARQSQDLKDQASSSRRSPPRRCSLAPVPTRRARPESHPGPAGRRVGLRLFEHRRPRTAALVAPLSATTLGASSTATHKTVHTRCRSSFRASCAPRVLALTFHDASGDDLLILEDLVGRPLAGRCAVVVRRLDGSPVVIENEPHLRDGTRCRPVLAGGQGSSRGGEPTRDGGGCTVSRS